MYIFEDYKVLDMDLTDYLIQLSRTRGKWESYMQKTCDVAEKAILAKKNLRKKCVNRDKM